MVGLLKTARSLFPIEYVVLTGGEALLHSGEVVPAIKEFSRQGVGTRLISNGYWGNSKAAAASMAGRLASAGLSEINISTGSFHSEFVRVKHAINAAAAAVEAGIRCLVNCELRPGDDNTFEAVRTACLSLKQTVQQQILFAKSNVVPMNDYSEGEFFRDLASSSFVTLSSQAENSRGCDRMLSSINILPSGALVSCCGLTMPQIPDMLQSPSRATDGLAGFDSDSRSILKLAIRTIGPQELYARAFEVIGPRTGLAAPKSLLHPCYSCKLLFTHRTVRPVFEEMIKENGMKEEIAMALFALEREASSSMKAQ